MKKGKIIIIVIWIFLLVGIFIYSKCIEKKEVIESIEPPVIEKEDLSSFQYIDYTGYYDENDLEIKKLYIDEEEKFSYIKISGLKDKTLETDINIKLYNMVSSLKLDNHRYVHSFVSLNAFNILSVYCLTDGDNGELYVSLNIDLVSGDEISLSDIVNSKSLVRPIFHAYYDTASFLFESKIKSYSVYPEFIEQENIRDTISKYKGYMSTIEDDSLKFARSFDIDSPFYITSAGIIIPNVNFYDINGRDEMIVSTKDNPRLFNFYYKYLTDDSIFDGSYSGSKNIMLSEYSQYISINKPYTKFIDDYALIHFEYFDGDSELLNLMDKYIERLNKDDFSFIYNVSYSDGLLLFEECSMTKDIYNNEVKDEFAGGMLTSRHTQGYYSLKSENISCSNKRVYSSNLNVEIISDFDRDDNVSINQIFRIINDSAKEDEINSSIESEINVLKSQYRSVGVYVRNVTEYQVFVEIDYYDSAFDRHVKKLTFDL